MSLSTNFKTGENLCQKNKLNLFQIVKLIIIKTKFCVKWQMFHIFCMFLEGISIPGGIIIIGDYNNNLLLENALTSS